MASSKQDGNRREKTTTRPKFRGREEVPIRELKYAEADGRYYGSGRAVFDILTVPVTLVLPWRASTGNPVQGIPAALRKGLGMALRKLDQDFGQRTAKGATVTDAGDYPLMLEYLCSTSYPDGSKRDTSSLVIVSDGSAWRVCLSDRDNGRVMWKTAATLLDALQAIELSLMADDPSDWRRSAEASGKRKK